MTKIENLLKNHPTIKGTVYLITRARYIYRSEKPIVRIQSDKVGYYLDEDGLKMPFQSLYSEKILFTVEI